MAESQDSFDDEIKKSGWILKRSKYRKKWKRTWLVLESSNLSYGKTEQVNFIKLSISSILILG